MTWQNGDDKQGPDWPGEPDPVDGLGLLTFLISLAIATPLAMIIGAMLDLHPDGRVMLFLGLWLFIWTMDAAAKLQW